MKKVFHDTGNGPAAELLYSIQMPSNPIFLRNAGNHSINRLDMANLTVAAMNTFRAAKSGNVAKLETLLRGVALRCAGFEEPISSHMRLSAGAKRMNMKKYREALGSVLLEKRDWMEKTLLHIAVDGKCMPESENSYYEYLLMNPSVINYFFNSYRLYKRCTGICGRIAKES